MFNPKLETVYIDNTNVPVFNKIKTFSSLRINELESLIQPSTHLKMIPYIKKNDLWWVKYYIGHLTYMRGFVFQITGTC